MDKKEIKRCLFIAVLTIIVCVIIENFFVVTAICDLALKSLRPMLLGCIMAYILNIILCFFEKHYFPGKNNRFITASRRPVCLVISFSITLAVIILILNIVIPEIVTACKLIYPFLTEWFTNGKDLIMKKLNEYPDIQEQINSIEIDKSAAIGKVTDWAFGVFNSALTFIGALTSTITGIVIGTIFAIYLLLRKEKLLHDIRRLQDKYISKNINRRVNHFVATAHETFTKFFIGQFKEAILIGTLTFIGASILRMPYAGMTGTIVGVTALIPIVGAIAGAALSAFLICTINPTQALIFLIFLIILQQLDNNILYPKVVGSSIGLPGIWVLASVTVGGGLFGIMGMLLSVPLSATVYKIYFENVSEEEKFSYCEKSEKEKRSDKKKRIKPEKSDKREKK